MVSFSWQATADRQAGRLMVDVVGSDRDGVRVAEKGLGGTRDAAED